jgi:outer membrane protein
MEKAISSSNSGSSILKQLNEINSKNLEYFKNKEKKIKDKEKKILFRKNIISEIEFKNELDELKKEINDYNKDKNKIINDFNQLKNINTKKLLKMINPILAKYSDEESISLILQKKDLIIGKTELDITEKIIKIINNEIQEFKIKQND